MDKVDGWANRWTDVLTDKLAAEKTNKSHRTNVNYFTVIHLVTGRNSKNSRRLRMECVCVCVGGGGGGGGSEFEAQKESKPQHCMLCNLCLLYAKRIER